MNGSARATTLAGSAPRTRASFRAPRDPIAIMLGPNENGEIITIFVVVAIALHVGVLVIALVTALLRDMRDAMSEDRKRLNDYFHRQYEVEIDKPKEEKPPEPPPPPPPPPEPQAPAPKAQPKPVDDDPYRNLPPAPAKAAKVLVAEPKPDDPVELPTIVNGEGTATYGQQSAEGKGDTPTMARNASAKGVPGGTGTATAAPQAPPPGEDHSRPVQLAGSAAWNCPFPPEADAEQIDRAVVSVQITVRPDGSALSVSVISDPGHGFGRAARACALAKRYRPALDRAGNPVVGSTPANINFSR